MKSSKEINGKPLKELLQAWQADKMYQEIDKCLNDPQLKVTLDLTTTDIAATPEYEWTIYADHQEGAVKGIHLLGKDKYKKPVLQESHYAREVALLERLGEAVVAVDTDLVVKYWSKAAATIHGLDAADVLGKKIDHVLRYKLREATFQQGYRQLLCDETWKGIVHYNNGIKASTLELSVTRLKDDDNTHTGYLGLIKDVTDYYILPKKTQDLVSIFSTLNEGFLLLEKEYRIAFVNEKANYLIANAYGIELSNTDNLIEKFPASKRGAIKKHLDRVYEGETISYQVGIPGPEGRTVWLDYHYSPIKNDYSDITGICMVLKDVTTEKEFHLEEKRRKDAEERLYQSRKLFEMIVEHAPLEAWVTDEDGCVQYMNPRYRQTFDCELSDAGKNIREIFPEEMANCCLNSTLNAILQDKTIETVETGYKKNGEAGIFRIFKFPIQFGGRRMAGGWSIDITEQVSLQNQLINQEKLKKREQIKSIIDTQEKERRELSVELHDNVNQILSSCKLMLEVAQENSENAVVLIKKSYHSLQTAITEIRKISHELNPSSIEDIGIIEAVQEMIEEINLSGRLAVQLIVEGSAHQQGLKMKDKITVYRIIQEQLNNILKHAQASQVIIELVIQPAIIRLTIKDNGVGFDTKEYKKGLGLKNISHRVEYYHGKMKVQSEKNEGCTMDILLNLFID